MGNSNFIQLSTKAFTKSIAVLMLTNAHCHILCILRNAGIIPKSSQRGYNTKSTIRASVQRILRSGWDQSLHCALNSGSDPGFLERGSYVYVDVGIIWGSDFTSFFLKYPMKMK